MNSLNLARRFGPIALVDPEAFHAHIAAGVERADRVLSALDATAEKPFMPQAAEGPFKNDSDAIPGWMEIFFPEQQNARIEGEKAVIPIHGVIDRGTATIERLVFGLADTDRIAFNFRTALRHPDVECIVLDIDSPGGNAQAIHETATLIAGSDKPVIARTDGMMCSAAYYLAAGADEIEATRSATVGSIGTYILHYDVTRWLHEMGVDAELFASGDQKGAGAQGVPLSDSQRSVIQERVRQHSEMFFSFVAEHRGMRPTDVAAMQGAAFLGDQAADLGLVDIIS